MMCISLKKDNIYTSLFLVISFGSHNPERKEQISFSFSCGLSLSCVWLFATPWTVTRQAPLSMEILQARILEWVAMSSSRGSSQPRDRTQLSHIAGRFFYHLCHPGKPMNAGVGSLSLLQGIFLTQESNWGLLQSRQILYQLSYQGNPVDIFVYIYIHIVVQQKSVHCKPIILQLNFYF